MTTDRERRVAALASCFAIFPPKGDPAQLEEVLRLYMAALEDVPTPLLLGAVTDLVRHWAPSYGRTCPSPQEIREAAAKRQRAAAERVRQRLTADEDARLARETLTPAQLRELAEELDKRATSGPSGVTLVWAALAGALRGGARAAEEGIGRPGKARVTAGIGSTRASEPPNRLPGPGEGGS